MSERYWVECAPGYVRLRHELGVEGRLRSAGLYTDGRWAEIKVAAEAAGLISPSSWKPDDEVTRGAFDEEDDFEPPDDPYAEEEEYWNELGYYLSLDDDERALYERTGTMG